MKRIIALLLILALAVSLFACGGGGKTGDDPVGSDDGIRADVDDSELIINPLTGLRDMHPANEGNRSIGVSVNNHRDSLPQAGLNSADLAVEMEVEGGITRMMLFFSDFAEVERVGSVRSLRDQFMEFAAGFNAFIVHFGASEVAKDVLAQRGIETIDGYYTGIAFEFDKERNKTYATEHCYFTDAELINSAIEVGGYDLKNDRSGVFANYQSPDETPITLAGGDALNVSFDFSSYGDRVMEYDAETGKYLMSQYGKQQIDSNTDEQWAVDNVFILFADITSHPTLTILQVVDYTGGTGYYINGGRYEEITWQKGNFDSPFKFLDAEGNELVCNPGAGYVAIVRNSQAETLKID